MTYNAPEPDMTLRAIHAHARHVLTRKGLEHPVTVQRRTGALNGYDLTVHHCPPEVGTDTLRAELKAVDGPHVAVKFDPHPLRRTA